MHLLEFPNYGECRESSWCLSFFFWFVPVVGAKFPTSSLSEPEVKAHREKERQDMCKILDEYIRICTKAGVIPFPFPENIEAL